jgi:hypothetical protein
MSVSQFAVPLLMRVLAGPTRREQSVSTRATATKKHRGVSAARASGRAAYQGQVPAESPERSILSMAFSYFQLTLFLYILGLEGVLALERAKPVPERLLAEARPFVCIANTDKNES